ncbi:hypothetical protein U1Q18_052541 [Sarracenia purpurea var. burkii]
MIKTKNKPFLICITFVVLTTNAKKLFWQLLLFLQQMQKKECSFDSYIMCLDNNSQTKNAIDRNSQTKVFDSECFLTATVWQLHCVGERCLTVGRIALDSNCFDSNCLEYHRPWEELPKVYQNSKIPFQILQSTNMIINSKIPFEILQSTNMIINIIRNITKS